MAVKRMLSKSIRLMIELLSSKKLENLSGKVIVAVEAQVMQKAIHPGI